MHSSNNDQRIQSTKMKTVREDKKRDKTRRKDNWRAVRKLKEQSNEGD